MATATSRLARVPPFERGLTLGDFLVPIRVGEQASTRQRHLLMVAIGTLLIILGARISFYLPGNPLVPVTLQTFGVLFSGALLGFRRGILAVLLYLLLGAVGLPVFAYDAGSAAYASGLDTIASWQGGSIVLGATGGYLIGFLLAGALVGRLAELGWDRHLGGAMAALLIGNAVIYAVGVPWLAAAASLDVEQALEFGLLPFIPGDLVKLGLAAAALPLGWWMVSRRSSER
jgi:biotin transport system substrate-specific component